MPKKTPTKKVAAKKTVAKKAATKKVAAKRTVNNKIAKQTKKQDEAMYFWGGLAIALCAAGAFMILAFGVGAMIH